MAAGQALYWYLTLPEKPEQVIGSVQLTGLTGEPELGYKLSQSQAGKGLGTEAVRAVLELARTPEIPRVTALVRPGEPPVPAAAGKGGVPPHRRKRRGTAVLFPAVISDDTKKGLSAFADSPFFCVGRGQSSMRSSLNTTGRAPSLQQVRMVWFTAQEGSPPCTMVNT